MPRWRLLLGGPLIWAMHFGAIYAVTSVSHVATGATNLIARIVVISISAICVVACGWIVMISLRRPPSDGLEAFWRTIALTGAILAAIAVVWQTLPVFAPFEGTPSR
jgi:hypothetical protein